MVNLCPVCSKDDAIQRVEIVVQAGVSSGVYSGPSGGVTYSDGKGGTVGGLTTLNGSATSNLAALLALPGKPTKETGGFHLGCGSILGFFAIVGACFVTVIFSNEGTSKQLGVALLVGLFYGIPSVLLLKTGFRKRTLGNQEYPQALEKWENAKTLWHRLYFCHRDGVVFNPESHKTCQPSQIGEFIYEES